MTPDSPAHRLSAAERRLALRLFLAFGLFYLLSAGGRLHTLDEYEAFYMTESLVERGTFAIPREKAFFGRTARDGTFHAPYGPLQAVAAAPGYLGGKAVAAVLGASGKERETLLWLFTSATSAVLCAAAVAVFFLLCRALGAAAGPSLVATLALGLATPLWHYATTFFSEPLSALLVIVAALAVVRAAGAARREGSRAVLLWAAAGAPLALLAGTRLTLAVLFPVFGLAVARLATGGARRRIAALLGYAAAPAAAVALYLAWNHARFGEALDPGYPPSFEGGRLPTSFDESFLRGLYGLTLSPGKGLFVFALPVLPALVLARRFIREAGPLALLLALPAVQVLFYATYSYWEGGYSWGPRFLVPTLSLWVLPLAFADYRRAAARSGVAACFAVSAAFHALGTSVSFLECQVERGYYAPGFLYDVGYSTPRRTLEVFAHYAREALAGRFLAEPEGLGFERWFFLLVKNGFPGAAVGACVAVLTAALIACAVAAWRESARLRREERERDREPVWASLRSTEREIELTR